LNVPPIKTQLLMAPTGAVDHASFAALMRADVCAQLLAGAPDRLKIAIAERPPRSFIPFARTPIALASYWGGTAPKLDGVRVAAYRVEESVPIAHDGWRDENIGVLTTFRKKRGLDRDAFLARWHEGHTPLAVRIHPFIGYVRNVVIEALDGAPPLDAIVEEHFATRADVLDPRRMFGGTWSMIPNMIRVGADIARFIDLGSMTNHLVREIPVRS
jgi:hypothetical protein